MGESIQIFLKAMKYLKDTSVLSAQMDQKCFFVIVARGNNRSISSLGIVYQSSGTFYYPAILENRIRIRGQEYFHDKEVTGSNRWTLLDPKYNLLTNRRDILIPAMERKTEKLSEGGTKKL